MKRNPILRDEDAGKGIGDEFLDHLKERMEITLLSDAADIKKVALGDYLKLMALLEERRKLRVPGIEEVVVRWKDPPTSTEAADYRNI